MMKRFIGVLVVLLLVVLSCCKKQDSSDDDLSNLIKKYRNDGTLNYGAYLIVPVEGCDGCILHSINYIKKNAHNEKIGFILSGTGKKVIRIKIGDENMNRSNVIVDSEDYAHSLKMLDVGPKVFFVNDGEVVKVVNLTVANASVVFDAMNKL